MTDRPTDAEIDALWAGQSLNIPQLVQRRSIARAVLAKWGAQPAPAPAASPEPLGVDQIHAAAKKLAECMDYPWEYMNHDGRVAMHKHAQAVIDAAHGINKGA